MEEENKRANRVEDIESLSIKAHRLDSQRIGGVNDLFSLKISGSSHLKFADGSSTLLNGREKILQKMQSSLENTLRKIDNLVKYKGKPGHISRGQVSTLSGMNEEPFSSVHSTSQAERETSPNATPRATLPPQSDQAKLTFDHLQPSTPTHNPARPDLLNELTDSIPPSKLTSAFRLAQPVQDLVTISSDSDNGHSAGIKVQKDTEIISELKRKNFNREFIRPFEQVESRQKINLLAFKIRNKHLVDDQKAAKQKPFVVPPSEIDMDEESLNRQEEDRAPN